MTKRSTGSYKKAPIKRTPKVLSLNATYFTGRAQVLIGEQPKSIYHMYSGLPGHVLYLEVFLESYDDTGPAPKITIVANKLESTTEWEPVELELGPNVIINAPEEISSNARVSVMVDQPCKVWYMALYKPFLPSNPTPAPDVTPGGGKPNGGGNPKGGGPA